MFIIFESYSDFVICRMSNKAKINDNLTPEKAFLNKSDTSRNEMKSFVKQGVGKNECVEANFNNVDDSFNKNTANKKSVGENHNHYESKRLMRSEKQ